MGHGLLRWTAALLLLVGLGVLARAAIVNLAGVEDWIQGLGLWGAVAYLGVFVVFTSVFVPDTLLAILAGAVFGLGWGTLAVLLGGILAASVQYLLARHVLRERIQRTLASRPRLAAIQRAVERDEVRLQWLLRVTPFNPTAVSYLLGAAGVRFPSYVLACLGLLPAFVVEVYVGYAGRDLATAAERQEAAGPWHDALVIAGLVACVLVLLLLTRAAYRAVRDAVEASEADG